MSCHLNNVKNPKEKNVSVLIQTIEDDGGL
jgi:hypothetical protein